ncbi:MAG: bifunctional 4-hydroxy-2-oxoglutarate aldolase/2-dehydro-3-deoxy-phosphogluconate aldolase [Cyanobacteria bacterium SBLK]|nr:bifunctional 4-hydroxy-2-oxoglutarate aldolase/2-dehydro-3-deoxy-phosphogluconate aldolase [Cyanobacteria bacterium SBLK]
METSLSNWLQQLQQERIIAVIRSPDWQLGRKMARAAIAGGINFIEIAWNSDRPAFLIEKLRHEFPHSFIGVGTIISSQQLARAIDAGVQFIFSPHADPQLIQEAIAAKIPVVPGALTPTEIISAWQAGATCVKVFPIQTVGGANYLKAIKAPLENIPLIPTGGVTLENTVELIEAGAIAVGLSSKLFPPALIQTEDWQAIAQRAALLKQITNN